MSFVLFYFVYCPDLNFFLQESLMKESLMKKQLLGGLRGSWQALPRAPDRSQPSVPYHLMQKGQYRNQPVGQTDFSPEGHYSGKLSTWVQISWTPMKIVLQVIGLEWHINHATNQSCQNIENNPRERLQVTVNPNQLISYRCANLKIEAQEI
jgi:hypothetical protein